MTPTSIAFDLDGTLIDSAPDICAMGNRVLAAEGASPMTLDEARGYVGAGAGAFVARMMAARDLPDEGHARLLEHFLDLYEGAVDLSVVYGGVAAALGLLAGDGAILSVCTNKPARPAQVVLDHFGLSARFGTVIGGDMLSVRKPDPAPLHAAFAGAPGARLFVGDSEVDAETAQSARVPFVLFTGGYRKTPVAEIPHDARFDHWDELPEIVARLRAGAA